MDIIRDSNWRSWWSRMSYRPSTGDMWGEKEDHWRTGLFPPSRNCVHNPATWGIVRLKNSWTQNLIAVLKCIHVPLNKLQLFPMYAGTIGQPADNIYISKAPFLLHIICMIYVKCGCRPAQNVLCIHAEILWLIKPDFISLASSYANGQMFLSWTDDVTRLLQACRHLALVPNCWNRLGTGTWDGVEMEWTRDGVTWQRRFIYKKFHMNRLRAKSTVGLHRRTFWVDAILCRWVCQVS